MDTRETIFEYIVNYMKEHAGHSPSLRQIMEGCKLSGKSQVAFHLDKLADEGRINRQGREITLPGAEWKYNGDGR